jgi:MOSC domain-containing protein YiiM
MGRARCRRGHGREPDLDGLLEAELWIGDRLRLPGCVLVVSEPRQPCFKFNAAMGFNAGRKLMAQSGYCGSYLAVIEPGSVQAGDAIELEPGPREVNLRELFMAKMREGPRARPSHRPAAPARRDSQRHSGSVSSSTAT